MKTFTVGRFAIGFFPYYIGFSNRTWGDGQRILDLGFIKVLWHKRPSAAPQTSTNGET